MGTLLYEIPPPGHLLLTCHCFRSFEHTTSSLRFYLRVLERGVGLGKGMVFEASCLVQLFRNPRTLIFRQEGFQPNGHGVSLGAVSICR